MPYIRFEERRNRGMTLPKKGRIGYRVCVQLLCATFVWAHFAAINIQIDVLTAVTRKNVDFWDIKTQLVPHRRHIISPLQSPAS
jgi:hypothetical protein